MAFAPSPPTVQTSSTVPPVVQNASTDVKEEVPTVPPTSNQEVPTVPPTSSSSTDLSFEVTPPPGAEFQSTLPPDAIVTTPPPPIIQAESATLPPNVFNSLDPNSQPTDTRSIQERIAGTPKTQINETPKTQEAYLPS